MVAFDFRSRLNQLMDSMFSEGISNPLIAVEQVSYLFFLRWLNLYHDVTVSDLSWDYILKMEDVERMNKFPSSIFPMLKNVSFTNHTFSNLMANSVFLISRPTLLTDALLTVDMAFSDDIVPKSGSKSLAEVGEAFEFLLNKIPATARAGVVLAEPELARLMCAFTKPRATDNVLDPSCGVGSLLAETIRYQQRNPVPNTDLRGDVITQIESKLTGADQDITMGRLASLNLMIHGINTPDIRIENLLNQSWPEKFDVILSNPSITAWGVEMEGLPGPGISQNEIQYMDRFLDLLHHENGRSALLVTEKILGETDKDSMDMRRKVFERCDLRAVISVPVGFSKRYPHPMALLYFTRGSGKDTLPYSGDVWFKELRQGEGEFVIKYFEDSFSTEQGNPESGFRVSVAEIRADKYNLIFSRRASQASLNKKSAQPTTGTSVKADDPDDDGLSELSEKLGDLLSNKDIFPEKPAVTKSLADSLISFLPSESRELVTYLKLLSTSDVLKLIGGKSSIETVGGALIELLHGKKAELETKAEITARQHPYYLLLHDACQITDPLFVNLNLLDIAKEAALKDFSIDELLNASIARGFSPMDSIKLKTLLNDALTQFLKQINAKFRFQDLQKVLSQLQFLPCYDVLSDIVLEGLKPGGPLRQVYLNKESNVPEVAEKREFILFNNVPGQMHIAHKLIDEAIIP